jgi:hypothetical protein
VVTKRPVAINRDSNPSKATQELLLVITSQDGSKGGNSHSKVGVILAQNVVMLKPPTTFSVSRTAAGTDRTAAGA